MMLRFLSCFAVAALAIVPVTPLRADAPLPEYQVKAAIVVKVAKFVSWPESSFDSGEDSLTLCIAGRDPFGNYMDRLEGQVIHGRALAVRRVDDEQIETAGCHVLFVGEESSSIALLRDAQVNRILTVGDSPGFASNGGMLGLRIENNRVRFEVNLDAAKDSELEISASLLQLATIITAKRSDHAFVH